MGFGRRLFLHRRFGLDHRCRLEPDRLVRHRSRGFPHPDRGVLGGGGGPAAADHLRILAVGGLGRPPGLQAFARIQDPAHLGHPVILALALLPFAEGEPDRGAGETEGLPELVLQKALVAEMEVPVGVGLDHEARGAGAHLGHEIELGQLAVHRRGRHALHRIPQELVQPCGGNALGVGLRHLVNEGKHLGDPLPGQGGDEDHG